MLPFSILSSKSNVDFIFTSTVNFEQLLPSAQ